MRDKALTLLKKPESVLSCSWCRDTFETSFYVYSEETGEELEITKEDAVWLTTLENVRLYDSDSESVFFWWVN